MEHSIPEELSDGTITIRRIGIADTDNLFDAASSSQTHLSPWVPWCPPEYTREDSRSWLALQEEGWNNGTEYAFGIVDAANGRYLGGVGFNRIGRINRLANLGYWVRSDSIRRGIATRATLLAARFGFEQLELNRIEIIASIENHASLRVAERVGAMREGVMRRRLMIEGGSHDAVMFSLVREEVLGA